MSDPPKQTGIELQKTDYLQLWQYFESRGGELKERMLGLITWVLGFAAAVLGFAVSNTLDFDSSGVVKKPMLLIILSITGGSLTWYADIIIREFAEHINRNFDRADHARGGNRSLEEILASSEGRTQPMPTICRSVRRMVIMFGVAFVAGLASGLGAVIRAWR
jgi:hypothetical protein